VIAQWRAACRRCPVPLQHAGVARKRRASRFSPAADANADGNPNSDRAGNEPRNSLQARCAVNLRIARDVHSAAGRVELTPTSSRVQPTNVKDLNTNYGGIDLALPRTRSSVRHGARGLQPAPVQLARACGSDVGPGARFPGAAAHWRAASSCSRFRPPPAAAGGQRTARFRVRAGAVGDGRIPIAVTRC